MTGVLRTVLEMSITGAYAAAVVMVLRLLLRRIPKGITGALWLVVVFRLLCPFALESSFSLLPALPGQGTTTAQTGSGVFVPVVPSAPVSGTSGTGTALPPPGPAGQAGGLSLGQLLTLLWLAGVLLLIGRELFLYLRLRLRIRTAVRTGKGVYETDQIGTAFVLGVLRPRIYLPQGLPGTEREYVLLHERAHIRRGDTALKQLGFLALCLHWFNPVVWLSFWLMNRDMEMACDERVMRCQPGDIRRAYSLSLVRMSVRGAGLCTLAFGECVTKRRVNNVLRFKKPAVWTVLCAFILVTAVGVGLAFNPQQAAAAAEAKALPGYQLATGDAVTVENVKTGEIRTLYPGNEARDGLLSLLGTQEFSGSHTQQDPQAAYRVYLDGYGENPVVCISEDFIQLWTGSRFPAEMLQITDAETFARQFLALMEKGTIEPFRTYPSYPLEFKSSLILARGGVEQMEPALAHTRGELEAYLDRYADILNGQDFVKTLSSADEDIPDVLFLPMPRQAALTGVYQTQEGLLAVIRLDAYQDNYSYETLNMVCLSRDVAEQPVKILYQ